MISYNEAIEILQKNTPTWNKIQKLSITECLDRILAVDIIAQRNFPEYKTASMDGYACKFDDLKNNKLKINSFIAAGDSKNIKLSEQECVKTFTGAKICDGCDTLVPIENVTIDNGYIIISKQVNKGFAIREVAESYKKGDVLLKKYTPLGFSEIALLAQLGFFHISVFIKPKVGVLSTGNEICDIGQIPKNGQFYGCNHIALANLIRKYYVEPIIFPIVKDDRDEIAQALNNALNSCDFLITTGGVSVGDFDFIKPLLKKDYQILIDCVSIKPGRHIKVAKFEDKFIFALPGFPNSCIVTCVLFFKKMIFDMFKIKYKKYSAFLECEYHKKSDFCEFVMCNVENKYGKNTVNFKGKINGSSAIINNLNNNAKLMVADCNKKANEIVEIIDIG